jgi:hypothetical protein
MVEFFLDALFPGDPLLCIGSTTWDDTSPKTREEWRGLLETRQFIVPSPMKSRHGRTEDGRPSNRGLEMVGPRRFLVVEFDPPKYENLPLDEQRRCETAAKYYAVKRDEQAARLHHLDEFSPLIVAVSSGGKSLHGWFSCEGQDEAVMRDFFCYAVSIGADKATWTKNQWVRLPDGLRSEDITRPDGRRQRVRKLQRTLYFNPDALPLGPGGAA